jgi:glucose/arabinose dehydrogenase
MKSIIFTFAILFSLKLFSQPVLSVDTFATGLGGGPIGLVNCGDDRVFAVCQDGYIMILDTLGNLNPVPFLDIDARVESDANAHGLLGLVFHPDYATNGYFYVNYINNEMNSVIARYSVGIDPNIADTNSEMIMLIVDQPYNVHKAGDMHFGPDGYLYFPFGDGGVAVPGGPGDPDNRAQNPETCLGKMLRIDVNGALPYEIPNTNPFYGATDTLNEIWAIGLRNPWRFSFDRLTGEMWLPDVGHDLWEEINYEPAGYTGGNNYGWRCYEANAEYNFDSCDATGDYTFPIYNYPHNDSTGGYSITGGYVYRGSKLPGLYGKYIYCDYVSGNFWTLEPDGAGGWINTPYIHLLENVVSFGEDKNGEIYIVVRAGGMIYKLGDKCNEFHADGLITNADCSTGNPGAIELTTDGGTEPYNYVWETGDTTSEINSLLNGYYTVIISDSIGCEITDSFFVDLSGEFIVNEYLSNDTIYADDVPGATYQWYSDGVILDGETNYFYVVLLDFDGIISCIITNSLGCMDTIEMDFTSGLAEIIAAGDGVLIYPNPASDKILLNIDCTSKASILIINSIGEIILNADVVCEDIMDVAQWPEGIYICTIIQNDNIFSQQFTVHH